MNYTVRKVWAGDYSPRLPVLVCASRGVKAGASRARPRDSSPSLKILFAAFSSRSITRPQTGQTCTRTDSDFSTIVPQPEHIWDVLRGSTDTTTRPAFPALYVVYAIS